MKKIITNQEAFRKVKDGDIVMVGGFLEGGLPQDLVKMLDESGAKDLTIISNDTGTIDSTFYNLIKSGKVSKIMASYIGSNPETGRLLMTKETEVILFPQGTLAEKIRAGGAGLGGVLTPVGIGTIVEEGKHKLTIEGKEYLLELPLKADIALIKANIGDEQGNLVIDGTSKNFNMVMATAAEYVIAQVDEIVPVGVINPNHVNVPSIFVDAIIQSTNGEVLADGFKRINC